MLPQNPRCECPNGAHTPMCPNGWAELSTSNAEAAANALAKTVKHITADDRARKFGSGHPSAHRVHRAGEVTTSLSISEMAHGRVLNARGNLDAGRAYVAQCEREFDRMPTETLRLDCDIARERLAELECELLVAIDIAQKIGAVI